MTETLRRPFFFMLLCISNTKRIKILISVYHLYLYKTMSNECYMSSTVVGRGEWAYHLTDLFSKLQVHYYSYLRAYYPS